MRVAQVVVVLVAVSVFVTAGSADRAGVRADGPVLRAFDGPRSTRELNLNELVPRSGRLNYVWYVPAGRTVPQVAVAWQFRDSRPVLGWNDARRYALTVWTPERLRFGMAHWVPHTLIHGSPFHFDGESFRLADVTRDGHDDFLVTVMCSDCNHATAAVSVYATFAHRVRRIYGSGVLGVAKGSGRDAVVRGRTIAETAWGARRGLIWFDEPRGGSSVCCPAYRLQTFMRWRHRGWRTVLRRKVRPTHDHLVMQGYPLP